MARTRRNQQSPAFGGILWRTALYARLSREDGDKPESYSIANQKKILEGYLAQRPDMAAAGFYSDALL